MDTTSYRIECANVDPDLAEERFPSLAQATAVAEFVADGEPFATFKVVAVDAPPTTTASAYLPEPGTPGYPGPCPEGIDWGEWLAAHNVD